MRRNGLRMRLASVLAALVVGRPHAPASRVKSAQPLSYLKSKVRKTLPAVHRLSRCSL